MVAVVGVVVAGWLPIAIAAVIGGLVMVLTGCITMEEAYQSIEWKAVFLVAGMLPLGMAMQTTGTAAYLANLVVDVFAPMGEYPLLIGLFVLAAGASQLRGERRCRPCRGP